jgi:hypothetical protein
VLLLTCGDFGVRNHTFLFNIQQTCGQKHYICLIVRVGELSPLWCELFSITSGPGVLI